MKAGAGFVVVALVAVSASIAFAQANPGSMGKPAKCVFKLEGKNLSLKPAGATNVEFLFERLP